jgi:hypothetical protein
MAQHGGEVKAHMPVTGPPILVPRKLPGLRLGSRAAPDDVLGNHLREKKIEKIVGPPSLRSSARHVESTERVPCHSCAGDFAIDVKIAHPEFRFHPFDSTRAAGEKAAGKREGRAIGDTESLIEVPSVDNREDRPKNFLLGQSRVG